MARGRFITLEGGEGAGKSTQTVRLTEALADAGIDAVATREPGGAPGAEHIRELLVNGLPDRWTPMTEALLHFAARADHVAATIEPALAAGRWVVSDRFTDSTVAYQGYAEGLGADRIAALADIVLDGLRPDLTLILDLPVDFGLERAAGRGGGEDRYERMGTAFHQTLRDGYLEIAAGEPERCVVIDANAAADVVAAQIRAAVGAKFGLDL